MTTAAEGDDAERARGEAVHRRALPPLTGLVLPRVS